MALQWYYRVMGQEAGPVSSSELQELAASGFLTSDVDVRKGAEGDWIPAGQVKGLFEGPSRMLLAEEVDGPVARAPSGPRPAQTSDRRVPPDEPVAEPPLSEPQAAEVVWFCRAMGREIGPLSLPAIKELAAGGFLSPEVLVRKGHDGDWVPANEVTGLVDDEPQTAPAEEDVKRSPAPPPEAPARDAPASPATHAPLIQIPDDDGLFALVKERTAEPPSPTPQAAEVSWYYQAMGEELGPVSWAELKELAETGFVTPKVLVRQGGDGRWVPASQVKGLFDGGSQPAEAERPRAVSEPEGVGLAPLREAPPRRPAAERPRKPTPRRPAAETRWYYEVEGQAQGPLTAAELKERAKSGQLAPDHLIRKGEDGNWVPAGQVKGLFPKASPSPPSSRSPAKRRGPVGEAGTARLLQCPGCGRQYKVWGEMAAKAMKCTCGELLRPAGQGPAASAPAPATVAFGSFLDEALAEPTSSASPESDVYGTLPAPPPRRAPAYSTAPTPAAFESRDSGYGRKKSAFGSGTVLGGLGVMALAALWFFGGLAVGYIFFYPPILFLIGLGMFLKGIFAGIAGSD